MALMLEAVRTCEPSDHYNETTRRYTPEDSKLNIRRRENLKSHKCESYSDSHLYHLLQNSAQRSINGSYYWLVWSKKKYASEIDTLNLNIDTEMTWAYPEADTNKITLHDLYKINYSWPINRTVAGHWDSDVGLNYNLTQFKYSRRQDMRGIAFTAGLAVSCSTTGDSQVSNAVFTFHLANGLCLHAQFRNHTSYSVHLI
jgi:hypothetical protein